MLTKSLSMSKLRADITYSHHLHNNSLITEPAIDNNNYVNQDPGILNGINNPADNLVPIEENNSEESNDEADEPQLENELANIFNTIICKYDAKFIYVLAWSDDEVGASPIYEAYKLYRNTTKYWIFFFVGLQNLPDRTLDCLVSSLVGRLDKLGS
ncbi:hypothetical protein GLOIN_2v1782581 [Rhizophagus clarus]|uniref:Uncharacterized protein n=1 Tax=Rhizophagus clarus TaxID=94130 RepID=A0A8H3L9T6_9GLOM|nr:hypothetical protein GLOIN_2v1782581 [Rhizophagus clarus]